MSNQEMNKAGEKRYRYKTANVHFSWNENSDPETETTIKIEWQYEMNNGKQEKHSYNRTTAQVEAFYVPLLRIIMGYDGVNSALLYLNDSYSKGMYLRIIEEGTGFLTFSGITLDKDNKWKIE